MFWRPQGRERSKIFLSDQRWRSHGVQRHPRVWYKCFIFFSAHTIKEEEIFIIIICKLKTLSHFPSYSIPWTHTHVNAVYFNVMFSTPPTSRLPLSSSQKRKITNWSKHQTMGTRPVSWGVYVLHRLHAYRLKICSQTYFREPRRVSGKFEDANVDRVK